MSTKAGKARGLGLIVGLVLIAMGVTLALHVWPKLQAARATKSWPTVQGVILSSEVMTEERQSTHGSGAVKYVPHVTYEYTVKGVKRSSDRITYAGYTCNKRTKAREIADCYPRGKKVQVYYDPDDPGMAVLEPGAGFGAYLLTGVGGVIALIGALVFGRALAPKRPEQARGSTTSKARWRIAVGAGGVVLLAGGSGVLLLGIGQLKEARASESWPTVQGTVIGSNVGMTMERDHKDGHDMETPSYHARVTYEYSVNGVTYSCNRISYGTSSGELSDAQQTVKRYPKGERVEVHYNPDDPQTAVLEPGVAGEPYLTVGVGVGFAVVGVVGLGIAFLAGKKSGRVAT